MRIVSVFVCRMKPWPGSGHCMYGLVGMEADGIGTLETCVRPMGFWGNREGNRYIYIEFTKIAHDGLPIFNSDEASFGGGLQEPHIRRNSVNAYFDCILSVYEKTATAYRLWGCEYYMYAQVQIHTSIMQRLLNDCESRYAADDLSANVL